MSWLFCLLNSSVLSKSTHCCVHAVKKCLHCKHMCYPCLYMTLCTNIIWFWPFSQMSNVAEHSHLQSNHLTRVQTQGNDKVQAPVLKGYNSQRKIQMSESEYHNGQSSLSPKRSFNISQFLTLPWMCSIAAIPKCVHLCAGLWMYVCTHLSGGFWASHRICDLSPILGSAQSCFSPAYKHTQREQG